ncbi:alternative ribosome rescue aminoacyl-tRNA hydrolase ArfB [Lentisphaerota bacterium ZTH]|nr:aminoacyl-tRNA hydrolase [Lentisphaerota bacterium]WET06410.1 alternative ribosome rescue aminoacyl-tRNA hydrolase ArfB [Lentisphaerota bacterium ZTH]
MIHISRNIIIPDEYLKEEFFLASGPGGQHVNKVATAVRLRFNLLACDTIPEAVKSRLVTMLGNRLTGDGELLIESRRHRSREMNRAAAVERLLNLIRPAVHPPRKRKATRPTKGSVERRIQQKKRRAGVKKMRSRSSFDD